MHACLLQQGKRRNGYTNIQQQFGSNGFSLFYRWIADLRRHSKPKQFIQFMRKFAVGNDLHYHVTINPNYRIRIELKTWPGIIWRSIITWHILICGRTGSSIPITRCRLRPTIRLKCGTTRIISRLRRKSSTFIGDFTTPFASNSAGSTPIDSWSSIGKFTTLRPGHRAFTPIVWSKACSFAPVEATRITGPIAEKWFVWSRERLWICTTATPEWTTCRRSAAARKNITSTTTCILSKRGNDGLAIDVPQRSMVILLNWRLSTEVTWKKSIRLSLSHHFMALTTHIIANSVSAATESKVMSLMYRYTLFLLSQLGLGMTALIPRSIFLAIQREKRTYLPSPTKKCATVRC